MQHLAVAATHQAVRPTPLEGHQKRSQEHKCTYADGDAHQKAHKATASQSGGASAFVEELRGPTRKATQLAIKTAPHLLLWRPLPSDLPAAQPGLAHPRLRWRARHRWRHRPEAFFMPPRWRRRRRETCGYDQMWTSSRIQRSPPRGRHARRRGRRIELRCQRAWRKCRRECRRKCRRKCRREGRRKRRCKCC